MYPSQAYSYTVFYTSGSNFLETSTSGTILLKALHADLKGSGDKSLARGPREDAPVIESPSLKNPQTPRC